MATITHSTSPSVGPTSSDPPLSPARTALLGVQQLLVSNVWLDPIFIASVGGLSAGLGANLVAATFLAAGLVTLAQTTRFVKLPIVEGPSSAFSPLAIGYAKAGALAAAPLGLMIGAGIVFLASVTGLIGRIRRILTPSVTGTIIALVGISLTAFGFQEFFGGTGSPDFGTTAALVTSCVTVGVVVVCLVVLRLRSVAFLGALVVGDLIALAFGDLDFSAVSGAAWFGLPKFLPYGSLEFDLGITITMCIVFFVAVVEAVGIYEATAEHIGEPLQSRRLSGGIAAESAGSIVAALIGGFGTTAYAQNLGVIKLTGVAKLGVVRVTAVCFIVLAFMPKVAAVLAATPAAVVGGILVPAAITVIAHGARSAFGSGTPAIGACAIAAALGIPPLTESLNWNGTVLQILSSQVAVGAIVAIAGQLCALWIAPVARAMTAGRPAATADEHTSTEASRVTPAS